MYVMCIPKAKNVLSLLSVFLVKLHNYFKSMFFQEIETRHEFQRRNKVSEFIDYHVTYKNSY